MGDDFNFLLTAISGWADDRSIMITDNFNRVRHWDIITDKIYQWATLPGPISNLRISPNGERIVFVVDGVGDGVSDGVGIYVYTSNGELSFRKECLAYDLCFTRDSRYMLGGERNILSLIDITSGSTIQTFQTSYMYEELYMDRFPFSCFWGAQEEFVVRGSSGKSNV